MNQKAHAGDVRQGRSGLVRRAVVAEWGTLFGTVRESLRTKRLAAVPLAIGATLLILLFDVAQHLPHGQHVVNQLGGVKAGQPLDLSLLRTPLSLFVPALDLPVWGALVQVLVVFGIAEIVLGRRATLVIAYACTLAGTLFARIGVALGRDHLPGLSPAIAHVRDTGPSAAVVALILCAAWRTRARATAVGVFAVMAVEVIAIPNLAGMEHIVALCTALLLAVAGELTGNYWSRVWNGVGAANLFAEQRAA
ncbi:hypothetical protein LN042_12995 [Kitasatospora sp. RB6PN24]|uniref:hypothetical protein n=1 Tax=Kitasatospora humi TaxID=2893891 RepID=UPI001E5968E4|nr:hypothetical protein [Kitasatospora humi]MCC9307998.1 hypothetical protein [Kitasatospora humi]